MTLHQDTYNSRKTPRGAKNATGGKYRLEERDYAGNEESRQRRLIVKHLHGVAHQRFLFLIDPLKINTQNTEFMGCNKINY